MNAILKKIEFQYQMNVDDIHSRLNSWLIEIDRTFQIKSQEIRDRSEQIKIAHDLKIKEINDKFDRQRADIERRYRDRIDSINMSMDALLRSDLKRTIQKEEEVDWSKEGF